MSEANYYRKVNSSENCGVNYARFTDPGLKDEPAIRTYPYSPDQVCVQLRAAKHYISATLALDVAEEFANAILAAVANRRA